MDEPFYLPEELWDEILKSPDLELDDIKNSRFVSRTWNGIASRILFDTLYVPWSPRERPYSDDSCQTRVQQRVNSCIDLLCHVTSSPHFASLIQAVCIDPVQCSETQYGYTRVADTTTMREKKIELWSCAQRAFGKLMSLRRFEIPSCNCYFPHSDRLDLDMKPIIAALPPFTTLVVKSTYGLPPGVLSPLHSLETLQAAGNATSIMGAIGPIITNNPKLKKIDLEWAGRLDLRALFLNYPCTSTRGVESFVLDGTLTLSDATSVFPHFRHLTSLQIIKGCQLPEEFWDLLRKEEVYLLRVLIRGASVALVRYMESYRGIEELEIALWAPRSRADASSLWGAISFHQAYLRVLGLGERICTLDTPTIRRLRCLRSLKRLTGAAPSMMDPSQPSKIDMESEKVDRIINEFFDHLECWPELESVTFEYPNTDQDDCQHTEKAIESRSFGHCRRVELRVGHWNKRASLCRNRVYVMMLAGELFGFRPV